jgi:subtilisin family serine protease
MFDLRRVAGISAAVGLVLVTLATGHPSTQGRRLGRTLPTVMVNGHEAVAGEVIVRYRSEAGSIGRNRAEFQVESDETESIGRRGARRVRSRRLSTAAMLQALRSNPDVEYAEPNYVIRLESRPNEPWMYYLWNLENTGQYVNGYGLPGSDISAVQAWDTTTGSRANVVGVIDTGIDYTHPDLAANIWSAPRAFTVTIGGVPITCGAGTHGFNAITNTCDPMDDQYHGTHVAGTIGAVGNNGTGVVGVNWVASMMGLKFLNSSGSGSTSDAIKAIEFAIQAKAILGSDANVRILNNSWGGAGYSTALANEIEAANSADMLFVAAAGNSNVNTDATPFYPSAYTNTNIVSVAASDNRDGRASFSNYGRTSVDLAAPGVDILSTFPGNSYQYLSGTSMATPHVSGAAALVLAACPMNTASLKSVLLSSASLLYSFQGLSVTQGRLNAGEAIWQCLDNQTPPTITPSSLTVLPGATINFQLAHGNTNPMSWVALYATGAADFRNYLQWQFMSGSQTPPSTYIRQGFYRFTAPQTAGTYEIRWFGDSGYTRIATSATITVAPPSTLTIADASIAEGNSGTTNMSFTVTLSPPNASQTVTVNYGTGSGTAFAGPDYQPAIGTLIFAPGVTSRTIVVPVIGDTVFEPNETLTVNLTNAVNAIIGDAQGIGTIINDDAPPPPTITPQALTVSPGATITFTLTNGNTNPMSWVALYPAAAGDVRGYLQWQYLNGAQSPPPTAISTTTLRFTVPTTGGTYNIRWFGDSGYTKIATSADITVAVPPRVSISDASIVEGNSGTSNATFTMTVSPPNTTQSVTVTYTTVNGTAIAPGDFTAVTGSVTFAPSASTKTISIPVVGDTVAEADETFSVRITSTMNAFVDDGTGIGTIVNDDVAPCTACPSVTPQSLAVAPGSTITFTLANGNFHPLSWVALYASAAADARNYLQWQFLDGTQTPPSTTFGGATLRFTAPATPGLYNIRWFGDGGYTRLAVSADIVVGTVSPTLTINDVRVTEGNSGTATATFTVTLSPVNSAQTVTVNYASANGTAASGSDYTAASGVLTFPASTASQTITVPILGDTAYESDETFTINLSGAVNASIGDATGVGTIADDDPAPCTVCPTITLQSLTVSRGATIQVTLANGNFDPLSWVALYASGAADYRNYLQWQFMDGTQTPPTYPNRNATLQFTAPQTAGSYEIRWFADGGYTRLATSATITVQ